MLVLIWFSLLNVDNDTTECVVSFWTADSTHPKFWRGTAYAPHSPRRPTETTGDIDRVGADVVGRPMGLTSVSEPRLHRSQTSIIGDRPGLSTIASQYCTLTPPLAVTWQRATTRHLYTINLLTAATLGGAFDRSGATWFVAVAGKLAAAAAAEAIRAKGTGTPCQNILVG